MIMTVSNAVYADVSNLAIQTALGCFQKHAPSDAVLLNSVSAVLAAFSLEGHI
jgi:hypothetical protein